MEGVRYISLHDRYSGYREAARRYLLGLKRLGVPLTWTPMVPGRSWGLGYEPYEGNAVGDPELDELCNKPIPYDTIVLHLVPEYYPLWVRREHSKKKIIGCTVWETDKLPRHWPRLLNGTDLLLVPSNWNRRTFRKSGVTTAIRVVPHCLCEEPPASRPWSRGADSSDYVFYTIGTWSARKAVCDTINAYLRTFTDKDPVALIVKTGVENLNHGYVPLGGQRWLTSRRAANRILRRYRHPAKVSIVTESLSANRISALHERGDCYVSLCRSEGWGLGAFDAAARGKPVIMTGYGGQTEFLSEDSAYRVDYHLVPVRAGFFQRSYTPDQNWAEPDLDHASRLFRHVFENREEARRRGCALEKHVRTSFHADTVARTFLNAIS